MIDRICQKKHICLWLLSTILYLFCVFNIASQTPSDFLVGYWIDSGAENRNEYVFSSEGNFYFKAKEYKNYDYRYVGSSGKWRVYENNIEVKVLQHYYWSDYPLKKSIGIYLIQTGNLLKYFEIQTEWRLVGELSKKREVLNDAHLLVNGLPLKYFFIGSLHDSVLFRYVSTKIDSIKLGKEIINEFLVAIKGDKIEWVMQTQ